MTITSTLADIDGIGPATVKKLENAGIATVADLAKADPAQLQKIDGMPKAADFAAWIAEAGRFVETAQGSEQTEEQATGDEFTPPPAAASAIASADENPAPDQAGHASAQQPDEAGKQPFADDPYEGTVLIVIGPKKGFRRAGHVFGPEPTELTPRDLGDGPDATRRLVAILREPRLSATMRRADGSVIEIDSASLSAIERCVDGAASEEDEALALEAFHQLAD